MHPNNRPGREGSVLVLTLVLVALLSGLVLQAQISSRQSLRKTSSLAERTRLYLAAQDATLHALRELAADETQKTDHLQEAWTEKRETTLPGGISIRTDITDLGRYFNLNNLSADARNRPRCDDIIMDLFTLCGDYNPIQRVDALKDWLDEDTEGFAEAGFYQEKDPPYEPSNRAIFSWQELLHVDAYDKAFFAPKEYAGAVKHDQVLDCVTLIPHEQPSPQPVNVNTASRSVLTAIFGLNNIDLVERIEAMRSIKPIPDLQTLQLAADPIDLAPYLSYLDVKSSYFTVQTRAYHENGSLSLIALAHRPKPNEIKIVKWVH